MTTPEPGTTFRARKPLGALGGDSLGATFTVTHVSRAGVVYGAGLVDAMTTRGRRYTGTAQLPEPVRFKPQRSARSGQVRLAEITRKGERTGWWQILEEAQP